MPDDLTVDPLVLADATVEIPRASVVICPACARSLVYENDVLRLATAEDTHALSDSERADLRKLQRQAETPPARNTKR